MSELPLYRKALEYISRNRARFHTPGHAGRADALSCFSAILPYDLTEIEGLDALYEASGAILETETEAAALFSAKRTLLSTGGATLCIQTMLGLAAPKGGRVVFSRSLHRSAIHACALLDIQPVFVYPDETGRIRPGDIETIVGKQSVSAVYITSPDYYGRLQDIKKISAVCKKHRLPLLVDNAHGAHLVFYGLHPLQLGADMTACSAHKTLPALTGGAFLNLADEEFSRDAKRMMAVFGSTSPSYLTLLSLDLCTYWCKKEGQAGFLRLQREAEEVRACARSLGFHFEDNFYDPARLRFETGRLGIDGRDAAEIFRKNGAEIEFSDRCNAILIATPFHASEDFECVRRALADMPPSRPSITEENITIRVQMACSVREAVFSKSKEIAVKNAAGHIAAQAVCPCPPGIPLVIPGEKIKKELSEFLLKCGIFHIKVVK